MATALAGDSPRVHARRGSDLLHDLNGWRRELLAALGPLTAERQIDAARAIAGQAVLCYIERRFGLDVRRKLEQQGDEILACPPAISERPAAIGRAVATLSGPLAAYALSTLYTVLLPPEYRSHHGVFYTPPAVAERLLDLAEEAGIEWSTASVLDPAAGGGAFTAPILRRIILAHQRAGTRSDATLAHLARHVRGLELDPFSTWMANVFATITAAELLGPCGLNLPRLVRAVDALDPRRELDTTQAALVVGNPPYGRVRLDASARRRFARSLYGHANLYGVFTDLAVRLTAPGGVIAFVTPASFLAGQYFSNLRKLLRAEAAPVALDLISDRTGVFADVLQETVLVTLRRGTAGSRPVQVHVNQPRSLELPCHVTALGSIDFTGNVSGPWFLPRTPVDAEILRAAGRLRHRLADYGYEVNTGPLVWNRHRDQLAKREGRGRYPLIWAEAIRGPGQFEFGAERRNHVPFVHVRHDQHHLVQRDPCVLVQRTTAKEQPRRLVATELPTWFLRAHGGAVVENHVNIVQEGAQGPSVNGGSLTTRALAALLNSAILDQLFRCLNGSVAVSAYELEALPLPDPDHMRALDSLVAARATSDEIDRFLRAAYLAPAEPLQQHQRLLHFRESLLSG